MENLDKLFNEAKTHLTTAITELEEYMKTVSKILVEIGKQVEKCGYKAVKLLATNINDQHKICIIVEDETNDCLSSILEKYTSKLLDIGVGLEIVSSRDECLTSPYHNEL